MIERKVLTWHPITEQPDFGYKGEKMRNLVLCSHRGYISHVTMNLDRWKHVTETHMFPNAVKWAYEE